MESCQDVCILQAMSNEFLAKQVEPLVYLVELDEVVLEFGLHHHLLAIPIFKVEVLAMVVVGLALQELALEHQVQEQEL